MTRTNWANVLTWSRLGLLIPITIAAYLQMRIAVLVMFILAETTDFLDGYIARKTNMASERGARLDSQVDTIMIPFILVWLLLLFPSLIVRTQWYLAVIGLMLGAQLIIAKNKLGTFTGLHLYSGKFVAIVGALALVSLFGFGLTQWTSILWTITLFIGIGSLLDEIIYLAKGGKNLDARFFWDP